MKRFWRQLLCRVLGHVEGGQSAPDERAVAKFCARCGKIYSVTIINPGPLP